MRLKHVAYSLPLSLSGGSAIRRLVSIMILSCIGFGTASAQVILTPAEVAKKARPAVVFIQCKNSQTEVTGSGFVITPDGEIVTALHVIRDMSSCTVQTSD